MMDTKTQWQRRVASWRASGETAAEFSKRHGFAPATLRWYASRLKREEVARPVPLVRMAQVIRAPGSVDGGRRGGVVVDLPEVRARITVEAGAERATLALVLDALGVGGAR